MGRPLDWIVVSLSLLVLFANRMLVQPPAQPLSTTSETVNPAMAPRAGTAGVAANAAAGTEADSPFAYIREDGSQVFLRNDGTALPPAQRMAMVLEGDHASALDSWADNAPVRRNGESRTAVYTWSSPISASPSSR